MIGAFIAFAGGMGIGYACVMALGWRGMLLAPILGWFFGWFVGRVQLAWGLL